MRYFPRFVALLPLLFLLGLSSLSSLAVAQGFDEQFDHWPVDLKIKGKVIWSNGLPTAEQLGEALSEVELKQSHAILVDYDTKLKHVTEYLSLKEDPDLHVTIATFDREKPADQLRTMLASADVIWWHLSEPLSQEQHAAVLQAKEAFSKLIDSGGVVITTGHAAELVGRYQLDLAGNTTLREGLDLVPDAVIAFGFEDSNPKRETLQKAVQEKMPAVGIGFDNKAMLLLDGRKIRVIGDGKATFVLPACEHLQARQQTIEPPQRRGPPEEWLIDLTQWRREAIDRTLPPFPPAQPDKPFVEKGTLVIVGGGSMPKGLMERFVELAGGREQARLVYIPCTEEDEVADKQRTVEMWQAMGVEHATFIHTKDRQAANSDEAILAPLREATGIWFGGGRQWNMADSYYGTEAHRLMKGVLRRGGVIGGSSAGASIQARYLARATPIGNFRIMAPGYERGGLGFISGVAIDQHFSQRGRQQDMTQLMQQHPQLLGIGLDEATAIVVQQSQAEVVGAGKAHFYDRQLPLVEGEPDYVALEAGSEYDLDERKVLRQAEDKTD